MRLPVRTVVLLVLLLFLGLFAVINWGAFSAPAELSLLVTSITAPVGVIMLGVVGAMSVLYLAFLAQTETKNLLEASKANKQLEKARALAEKAEASRFSELQELLTGELTEIKEMQKELLAQSEAAAVDLAETVLGETEELAKRIDEVEGSGGDEED